MSEWGRFLIMGETHSKKGVKIDQICERYEYGMAREAFELSVIDVLEACKRAARQNHIYDEEPYLVEKTDTMAHIHNFEKEMFITLIDATQN